LVSGVKPGGSGMSNDGNIYRGFFFNYRKSARITGVDDNRILRFYVILQSISSGFELNIEEFNQYAEDTAKLFVKEYPWFCMPACVHKILVLGGHIVSGAILPSVYLSEEAQESRNKDRKYLRRSYSRKISRSPMNEEVFSLLLVSSDPRTWS
jgi:hypothetical protein